MAVHYMVLKPMGCLESFEVPEEIGEVGKHGHGTIRFHHIVPKVKQASSRV
jgi:hypothetical protein